MNAMMPALVAPLGWALIHFLWQGLLVGMAAAIALTLLRNARPQLRYFVSCAALVLCLALPILGVWRGLQADASLVAAPTSENTHFIVVAGQTAALPLSWQATLQDRLPSLVALWSIGAGLFALRMALGMLWVGRIGRSGAHASDQRWQVRLDRLAAAFGMQREIRLRVVDDLDSPVAAGWWRPMVLVPAMLVTRMPPDLLEALLAHELAHIKRHDYLVNLLQSAIEALLFYHPVVWWLSRQIRIEREQIADDLAAVALGEPRRLALALQALDKLQLDHPLFPSHQPAPAANGGNLMARIQRLIRPNQHALNWKLALPIIGLAAFCLTVYAHDGAPVAASVKMAAAGGDAHTTGRISQTSGRQADAYALIRAGQDGMVMSGDTRDIPAIEKVKANVQGDFIWARHGQKAYVVQDPAVIAKVIEARRPADALDVQMQALDAKMAVPSKQMDALSAQMEALEKNSHPYNEAMEKTGAQMEALGRQQEAIGRKMEALERQHDQAKQSEQEADAMDRQMQTLQAQMEPLDQQMEQLSAAMEAHNKDMQAAQQPMEDLSRQMEAASKPMEALGKQMDVLGKQMEQVSRETDQAVQGLIDEAVRNGKAVPAGTAVR